MSDFGENRKKDTALTLNFPMFLCKHRMHQDCTKCIQWLHLGMHCHHQSDRREMLCSESYLKCNSGMCVCVYIKMHTCRHPELSSCTHKVQVLQWDSWDFIESPWKQALSLFCLKVALDFLQQLSDSVKRSCTLIWRDGWLGLKIVSIIKYVIGAGMWSQAF